MFHVCLRESLLLNKSIKPLCYYTRIFINLSDNPNSLLQLGLYKYLDPSAFGVLDGFFTFGIHSAETLAKIHPKFNELIHGFGNPRTDLLRPEFSFFYQDDVDALTTIYDDYVLYCDSHSLPELLSDRTGTVLKVPEMES